MTFADDPIPNDHFVWLPRLDDDNNRMVKDLVEDGWPERSFIQAPVLERVQHDDWHKNLERPLGESIDYGIITSRHSITGLTQAPYWVNACKVWLCIGEETGFEMMRHSPWNRHTSGYIWIFETAENLRQWLDSDMVQRYQDQKAQNGKVKIFYPRGRDIRFDIKEWATQQTTPIEITSPILYQMDKVQKVPEPLQNVIATHGKEAKLVIFLTSCRMAQAAAKIISKRQSDIKFDYLRCVYLSSDVCHAWRTALADYGVPFHVNSFGQSIIAKRPNWESMRAAAANACPAIDTEALSAS